MPEKQARPRLTSKDITLKQVLYWSKKYYKKKNIDDKSARVLPDIKSAKLVFRRGMKYNRKTKKWEQESREVKIEFRVKSEPTSYKKNDNVSPHIYPLTILIKNWDLGLDSPFRIRSGSFAKWEKPKKKISEGKTESEKKRIREKNSQIRDRNIRKGLDGSFIFELMWVYNLNGILYGPMTAKNKQPKIKNPKLAVYFDKHSYFIVSQVLPRLFKHPTINKIFKVEK